MCHINTELRDHAVSLGPVKRYRLQICAQLMPPMKLLRCTNSKSHTIYQATKRRWRAGPLQIGSSLGMDIPTPYSEPHTPPPNALRSIDDTPPPSRQSPQMTPIASSSRGGRYFFTSLKSVYAAQMRMLASGLQSKGRMAVRSGIRALQNSRAGEKMAKSGPPPASASECPTLARN